MISQGRYVDITSGVGAGSTVSTRQYILRLVTQNPLVAAGAVQSFNDPDDVGTFFGVLSEEYARAQAYFGFISKSIRSAAAMSFVRWVATAIAPQIVSDTSVKDLAALQAVTAGTLTFNVDGTQVPLTGFNLSSAVTLTDVASLVATKINASTNPSLATNSSFTYNTTTQRFTLVGAAPGEGSITAVATGLSTDISVLLGISGDNATATAGQAAQTAVQAISSSASDNNNFGSYAYVNAQSLLSNDMIVAIAQWNKTQNNMYIFTFATDAENAAVLYPLIKGYSGVAMNILSDTLPNDFVEQCPAEVLAATDYNAANATQNYMFYQFDSRNVTVNDDLTADAMDAIRANYIGQTQAAGNKLAFYQRGVLMGSAQDAVDINIYANEMWFKDYLGSQFLNAFLSLPIIPADDEGEAILTSLMQGGVDLAKTNGTISVGKSLTTIQQLYINQLTDDNTAWRQVQTIGYWFRVQMLSRTNPNSQLTEWYAKYLLVYSKNDAIRAVEGQDVLI